MKIAMAKRQFGKNLRVLREDRGFSIAEIAHALDQSYDSITKYERGEREPSLAVLIELASLLRVTIDRLVMSESARSSSRLETFQRSR